MNDSKARHSLILKVNLNPERWISALPGLFYIANLLLMLSINGFIYRVVLVVTGLIGIFSLLLHSKRLPAIIPAYIFIYMVSLAFNCLTVRNVGYNSLVVNLLLFGVFLIMLIRPWSMIDGVLVFYTTTALILFVAFFKGTKLILTSSTNYLSVLMLLASCFYYISLEREIGKIRLLDLLPAVITFAISIWGEGRGGIISCAFLLVFLLIMYMRTVSGKNGKRALLLWIVFLIAAILVYLRNYNVIDVFLRLGKFRVAGLDNSDRLYIWNSYFSKTKESALYFLVGAPLNEIPIIAHFAGNIHNSFLQLHSYGGVFICIITAILMLKSLITYIRNKQYIILILMLSFTIRGTTDKYIFGQYGMPIMLFFIFYSAVIDKQKNNSELIK